MYKGNPTKGYGFQGTYKFIEHYKISRCSFLASAALITDLFDI